MGRRAAIEAAGGDPSQLQGYDDLLEPNMDPEAWIPASRELLFLNEAARIADCQHFGLIQANFQDALTVMGNICYAVQTSADVRSALQNLISHSSAINQGINITLHTEQGRAFWGVTCGLEALHPTHHQADLLTALGLKLIRTIWHPEWTPDAVYLTHAAPGDTRPYVEFFGCPVYFNWDRNYLVFPATLLDQPLSSANPSLHRLVTDYLRSKQPSLADNISEQVSVVIEQAMLTGDCSIEKVAAAFATSKRTLQRRLAAAGLVYSRLVNDVRFKIAKRYLSESDGSLSALADMLCYSSISAFSIAFRRNFDMSPREWRTARQKVRVSS